jgi:hypothetical protein
MRRALALAAAAFLALAMNHADAAPCPPPQITSGYGTSFFGQATVAGFTWDQNSSRMYVNLTTLKIDVFVNVPYGAAQGFYASSSSPYQTPDQYFAQNVAPYYEQGLLAETCTPILTELSTVILTD